jgi:hypothetical protein
LLALECSSNSAQVRMHERLALQSLDVQLLRDVV